MSAESDKFKFPNSKEPVTLVLQRETLEQFFIAISAALNVPVHRPKEVKPDKPS
jgi:hypothetical protein